MSTRHLIVTLLALVGCATPEPDEAIVTVDELRDHPGHPCASLLPGRKGARNLALDKAEACTVDHCLRRVGELDPGPDARQLHRLCMGDGSGVVWSLEGCRLAACERLLPAVPGLAYKLSATSTGLLETEAWTGPMSESSDLLEEVLALGDKASCGEVLRLAAVLETMVIKGQAIPWDLGSARAALRLARWHVASCPGDRGTFAEVLYLVPADILEQLRREDI
jgi:hypothetical protein